MSWLAHAWAEHAPVTVSAIRVAHSVYIRW